VPAHSVQARARVWGSMINEAMNEWHTAPHLVLAPGAVIALVVFAINFVRDGLNDALNPRRRYHWVAPHSREERSWLTPLAPRV
ncbi:MAG: hypothetical protein LC797_04915, partial [Chloroflexi bacterium]|nr:hypothetical protein [Chloroflexota bacterium]